MNTLSKNANLTIRIDKNLKEQAEELFKDLGITTSSAITMFFKQAVREKSIPFSASLMCNEDEPSKEMKKLLKEIKDIEHGKGKRYENLEDLWKDLGI